MSLATIHSFAFSGIEAVPVDVQCQIASGLPTFLIAGPVTQQVVMDGTRRLCEDFCIWAQA
jgi:magnesium chelatase family protein